MSLSPLSTRIVVSFGIAICGSVLSSAFAHSPLPPPKPSLPFTGTAQAKDVTPPTRAAPVVAQRNGTFVRRGVTLTSPLLPKTQLTPITHVQQQQPVVVAAPVRIRIPSIGVDANLETLGLLPSGQLDVPKAVDAAGWYTRSPKPGETGKAIIDGHLDIGSTPGVFWNLHKVKAGEDILVRDAQGAERTFRVQRTEVYDVTNAPMQEIFAGGDSALLNIITCAGVWRKELNHYDKRLVVYAQLLDTKPAQNVALR